MPCSFESNYFILNYAKIRGLPSSPAITLLTSLWKTYISNLQSLIPFVILISLSLNIFEPTKYTSKKQLIHLTVALHIDRSILNPAVTITD
ncbi:11026_t:CDS:2 [Entrophospora sp. SA101]|nr:11026_t:CDS:2 [Entrophospora sp. SA101]